MKRFLVLTMATLGAVFLALYLMLFTSTPLFLATQVSPNKISYEKAYGGIVGGFSIYDLKLKSRAFDLETKALFVSIDVYSMVFEQKIVINEFVLDGGFVNSKSNPRRNKRSAASEGAGNESSSRYLKVKHLRLSDLRMASFMFAAFGRETYHLNRLDLSELELDFKVDQFSLLLKNLSIESEYLEGSLNSLRISKSGSKLSSSMPIAKLSFLSSKLGYKNDLELNVELDKGLRLFTQKRDLVLDFAQDKPAMLKLSYFDPSDYVFTASKIDSISAEVHPWAKVQQLPSVVVVMGSCLFESRAILEYQMLLSGKCGRASEKVLLKAPLSLSNWFAHLEIRKAIFEVSMKENSRAIRNQLSNFLSNQRRAPADDLLSDFVFVE